MITFAARPTSCFDSSSWRELTRRRRDLFDPALCRDIYRCDAYFVELGLQPEVLVNRTKYWFGLFSHQRDTFLWKGMLEVPLADDRGVSFLDLGEEDDLEIAA